MKYRITFLVTVSILISLAFPALAASPNVSLVYPQDGYLTGDSYVEFSCNASDDEAVSSLGLYTDISGSFEAYDMKAYGELQPGLGHTMLCHFNQNYSCWDSARTTQTNLTQSGVSFEQGKMGFGAGVETGDNMRFGTSSKFSIYYGSVEFWFMPRSGISGTRYLFMAGESDVDKSNQIRLYINSTGQLVFEWYYDESDLSYAYADASWLQNDTWYHIAATWDYDYTDMDIYINGSSSSMQGPWFGSSYYPSWTPTYGYIGSKFDSSAGSGGTFDEFMTFSTAVSPSGISNHYSLGLGNHTTQANVSSTWNLTGLSDGSYIWNCYAADNESNSIWNGTNYTFHIDAASPPDITGITHSPQGDDALDPGVTINVTANLTDPSGVNTTLLQYRRESESLWTDIVMGNVSEQYNASFVAAAPHDTWYYRIWANDSMGNEGNSSEGLLEVDYDYTWSTDTNDLGTTYAYIDSEASLGVVTISNTGDYPMSYRISSTYPDMTYNVTDPLGFDVPSGSNISVEINVTASSIPYEYNINMTLDAISSNADPSLEVINATLVAYVGGPHLAVDITSAPVSVSQSDTGVNFTARVKNIGNETAHHVWLNFTMPSGFYVTSGNTTQNIGNLSQGEYQTSTVTVTVSPSEASAGAAIVTVNASCNQSVNGSDYVVVAVSCTSGDGVCGLGCGHSTDNDCPSGGGGSTTDGGTTVIGGGSAKTSYVLVLDMPERLDINRGENKSFAVTADYGLSFTADDVRIILSGYPYVYTSVNPESYDYVNDGDSMMFDVNIIAPPYIKVGQYELAAELSGRGKTTNYTLGGYGRTMIFVHSAGNELDLFEQARQSAQDMAKAGYSTEDMATMTEQLDSLVDDWDYDAAQELAHRMIATAELAFRVKGMLDYIGSGMQEAGSYGFSTDETDKLYMLSQIAFERGDYERAEERAVNARSAFSMETFGLLPLISIAREGWWLILTFLSVAGVSAVIIRRRLVSEGLKRKLRELDLEETSINKLILGLQKNYFSRSPGVGAESYSRMLEEHMNNLAGIKRRRLRLISGTGKKSMDNLRKERDSAVKFIKDIQVRHFSRNGIGRELYGKTMREIRKEIGDVEKEIDMASKRKKTWVSLSVVIVLVSLISPWISVQAGQDISGEIAKAEQAIQEMAGAGFGTSHASDTLMEANIMLERGEFTAAQALAREVVGIRDSAFDADRLIDQSDEAIYMASLEGIDVSGIRDTAEEGVALFESENYIESKDKLDEAIELLETLRSEAALQESLKASPGERLAELFTSYWPHIIVVMIAGLALSFLLKRKRQKMRMKKRLSSLEKEKASLKGVMKNLQRRYFENNSIGKSDFDAIVERYRKRLAHVDKQALALKEMLGEGLS